VVQAGMGKDDNGAQDGQNDVELQVKQFILYSRASFDDGINKGSQNKGDAGQAQNDFISIPPRHFQNGFQEISGVKGEKDKEKDIRYFFQDFPHKLSHWSVSHWSLSH